MITYFNSAKNATQREKQKNRRDRTILRKDSLGTELREILDMLSITF